MSPEFRTIVLVMLLSFSSALVSSAFVLIFMQHFWINLSIIALGLTIISTTAAFLSRVKTCRSCGSARMGSSNIHHRKKMA